jgi:hypothetical protein
MAHEQRATNLNPKEAGTMSTNLSGTTDVTADTSTGTSYQNPYTYLYVPSNSGTYKITTTTTTVTQDANSNPVTYTPVSPSDATTTTTYSNTAVNSTAYKNVGNGFYIETVTRSTASASSTSTTADDSITPGAVFRLGSYSELEQDAYAAGESTYKIYYPAQHIADESGSAIYMSAGGKNYDSGILLACSGRVLVRAGEKMYINSAEAMHIESEDTITIKSGSGKDITISAGDGSGNIVENVSKATKNVGGDSYTHVTGTSRTYTEADSYSYTYGNSTSETHGDVKATHYGLKNYITLGQTRYYNVAGGVNLNCAATVSLAFGISASINATASFGVTAFDFSIFGAMTFICGATINVTTFEAKQFGVGVEAKAAEVKAAAARLTKIEADIRSGLLEARQNTVALDVAGIKSCQNGITSYL